MNDFFKAAWSDIKNRRNLELYIVLTIAVAILFADVLGLQTASALFEIILASLAVLIFGFVMIDPDESHGFCFVDIYHHKTTAPNATFKLSSSDDGFWYGFFREQYEKLWQSCRVEEFAGVKEQ